MFWGFNKNLFLGFGIIFQEDFEGFRGLSRIFFGVNDELFRCMKGI